MRTYKFRAVDVVTEEYKYGLPINQQIEIDGVEIVQIDAGHEKFACYRETLSQYIEQNDRNNNEIYENDIVTDGVFKYKVVWNAAEAGWGIQQLGQSTISRITPRVSDHYTIVNSK